MTVSDSADCVHSWRLLSEKAELRPMTAAEVAERDAPLAQDYPGAALSYRYFYDVVATGGTICRWYCTRCRRLDTTVVPRAERSEASTA